MSTTRRRGHQVPLGRAVAHIEHSGNQAILTVSIGTNSVSCAASPVDMIAFMYAASKHADSEVIVVDGRSRIGFTWNRSGVRLHAVSDNAGYAMDITATKKQVDILRLTVMGTLRS